MISVLVPTRGRPDNMRRVVESARDTAKGEIEFIFYVDNDDVKSRDMAYELDVTTIVGERILLSEMWNRCWEQARFDVGMHCGDDIIFRSAGWDQKVLAAFDAVPDKIVFVHGRDGIHDRNLGTHGFIHRCWVETLGYFVPPYFASDYNDLWLTEVADKIGRRVFLEDVYTEHMHPNAGKGPLDQTHLDRIMRHSSENCKKIWHDTAGQRDSDAEKLRAVIERG